MGGMARFLTRVEKLSNKVGPRTSGSDLEVSRLQHQTIKRVTAAMVKLRYNVAIAALMEYVNGLEKFSTSEVYKSLLLMLAPFAPFTSEELWEKLGGKFSIHQQSWPKYEEKLTAADAVTLVIQVNGKLRKKAEVAPADSQNKTKMIALAKELTGQKNPIKAIFVPGRLVNLVVK